MRLDSGVFLVAFAVFVVVYACLSPRGRRRLLVAGNVAFYATVDLRFVPLLLGLGAFTFIVAGRMHRESSEPRRARFLWLGVGVNVAALLFFKAAAPSAGACMRLLSGCGRAARLLDLAPPLGISFYALQAVSYVVDVHRRAYEPPRDPLAFFASFTLFPHLLSGPIVRSSFLVPQIERAGDVDWPTAKRALLLFSAGLLKKAVADRLAPIADGAFDATAAVSSLQAWTGLFAYAGQLYGDFSGYTDMATALALMVGLELPPNFDLPYLATSPVDFWRRWHISLSGWLRDYVYLPLGVRFRRRRYANIVATWVVAGLWHGVTWLFLLYGFYHGILLSVTEWLSRRFEPEQPPRGLRRAGLTLLTFHLVLMGYVLFRARSVAAAGRFLAELYTSRAPSHASYATLMTLVACLMSIVLCHLLDHAVRSRREVTLRPWVLWPAMAVTAICVALFGGPAQPFIYFAF